MRNCAYYLYGIFFNKTIEAKLENGIKEEISEKTKKGKEGKGIKRKKQT